MSWLSWLAICFSSMIEKNNWKIIRTVLVLMIPLSQSMRNIVNLQWSWQSMFMTDSLSPAAMMGWCERTEYHVSLLDTSMFPCKFSCDMNYCFLHQSWKLCSPCDNVNGARSGKKSLCHKTDTSLCVTWLGNGLMINVFCSVPQSVVKFSSWS